MRRLFCILLLICLPLQSFAAQIGGLQATGLIEVVEQADGAEDLHHHHEDDGSVHYDDSAESLAHADEHSSAAQFSFLNPADLQFSLSSGSFADYPDPISHIPNPCLDDPQRPPSFAPGLAAGG